MSIYYCEECDRNIDGDWFICVEHPTQAEAFCCEACAERIEEEEKEELKRMRSEYQREVESGLKRRRYERHKNN